MPDTPTPLPGLPVQPRTVFTPSVAESPKVDVVFDPVEKSLFAEGVALVGTVPSAEVRRTLEYGEGAMPTLHPRTSRASLLKPKQVRVITSFTTPEETTVTGGAATIGISTLLPLVGSVAPNVTMPANVSATRVFFSSQNTVPVNVTGKVLSASVRVMVNPTGISAMKIRLYSDATPGANYHVADLLTQGHLPISDSATEWTDVSTTIERFTAVGTGATLTSIVSAALEISTGSYATPPVISLGQVRCYQNALKRGAVVFYVDNVESQTVSNYAKPLVKAGMPAVLACKGAGYALRDTTVVHRNEFRIVSAAASPTAPLIRVVLAENAPITNGNMIAISALTGVTDNGAAMNNPAVYQIANRVDAKTFDLAGTVFGGTAFTSVPYTDYCYASTNVVAITDVKPNPTTGKADVTVASAAVLGTATQSLRIIGVTGSTSVNGYVAFGAPTGATLTATTAGVNSPYTGGGYAVYGYSDFMSVNDALVLQDRHGWQMQSYDHSWSMAPNAVAEYNLTTDSGVAESFRRDVAFMASKGFTGFQDGTQTGAYTMKSAHVAILRRLYRSRRMFYGGQWGSYRGETLPIGDPKSLRTVGWQITASTPSTVAAAVAGIKANIAAAAADKTVCAITMHAVMPFNNVFAPSYFYMLNMDPDSWQSIVDYAKSFVDAGTLDVMTIEQLAEVSNTSYS